MAEFKIRTKISKGFQVVVPSALRRQYKLEAGDEVIWGIRDEEVVAEFHKRRSLDNIVSLGSSGTKSGALELKKRIQKGEL